MFLFYFIIHVINKYQNLTLANYKSRQRILSKDQKSWCIKSQVIKIHNNDCDNFYQKILLWSTDGEPSYPLLRIWASVIGIGGRTIEVEGWRREDVGFSQVRNAGMAWRVEWGGASQPSQYRAVSLADRNQSVH